MALFRFATYSALAAAVLTLAVACGAGAPATDPSAGDAASANDSEISVDNGSQDLGSTLDTPDSEPVDIGPVWQPSAIKELFGFWVNDDGDNWRVFEFGLGSTDPDMVEISPAYYLFKYPKSAFKPVQIQRGRASLALGPVLVLKPVWASDPQAVGQEFKQALLPAPLSTIALEVGAGSGNVRIYTKSLDFP